ncbi:nucleotidyltransferase family protein [Phytoactinopolyspora mesophila]|uniref:Uncharacterized protein n=1 Tax=Phytoactinopolyspora mesophila TaxID=2650750 RepID=A0A7K3MAP4_9ACTN|nr:nucleotidyltransferase domain-containing protein [Phytoactinopolyspora mesophila]NDL60385.1 hypothetical protein [Phytoactinopolyspora mesophila]
MDVSRPELLALQPGTAGVLRVLSGADAAFTMRSIARLAGVSHTHVGRIIGSLVEQGVVYDEVQGASRLCRLNWSHLATGPLVELIRLHSRMIDLLRAELTSWELRPEHASLFGSAARGDGDTSSDLDILLVRTDGVEGDHPTWRTQLYEAAERIRTATGNHVAWFDISRPELQLAVDQGEAVIEEWRRDAVPLAGVELDEVLGSLE